MSHIICPTCGTNGLDCLRKDCQMVADQLAPWTGREVFASMADADAVLTRMEHLASRILEHTSRMAIDDAPKPLDPGAGAVAGRVDGVIQDALAGLLTKSQKTGLRSAIDRSDRVSPSSDQAVGKAIGG